jgi:septal ring factor EnvC (AmiA/AmiB activator)
VLDDRGRDARVKDVRAELAQTERQLANLAAAVAAGGSLPALVKSLQTHDERRQVLEHQLRTLERQGAQVDRRELRREVAGSVKSLRSALTSEREAGRRLLGGGYLIEFGSIRRPMAGARN